MAKGWESKSVEAQIDMSEGRVRRAVKRADDASAARPEVESLRKKESLQLSIRRVMQELQSAENPRYRALLDKALTDLQGQLAGL
jgi:hypothetical protein